jgi:hypothetical protein
MGKPIHYPELRGDNSLSRTGGLALRLDDDGVALGQEGR